MDWKLRIVGSCGEQGNQLNVSPAWYSRPQINQIPLLSRRRLAIAPIMYRIPYDRCECDGGPSTPIEEHN
jgi:hypothetical protein